MSAVHNLLIRGINAIYLQAVNVAQRGTKKDKLDFSNFCWVWSEELQEHHNIEETMIFPEINELAGIPDLMDANVEEHKMFHDGLDSFRKYIDTIRKEEEELDGEKLREIIDSFMPILRTHLENEIGTLVGLEKYADKCDWGAWFGKKAGEVASKHIGHSSYRTDILPLVMVLHDKTFEGGVWQSFPPIPWLAAVAIRWVFVRTNLDWWRFSGCDTSSQPQDLPFA
ncbi:hypothetical protein ACHAPJ_007790 [Fusarium lateritium]